VEGCLSLSGDLFVALSLDKEIFDNKSLFDFAHHRLGTESADPTGRFTIIRTLDEYVLVVVSLLRCIGDILSLKRKYV
jgi:hypothetical protein